jgi:hypothetical protein
MDGTALGEIVLNIGFTPPVPIWGASAEEQLRRANLLRDVEVQPVVRIAMAPERLMELHQILDSLVTQLKAPAKARVRTK